MFFSYFILFGKRAFILARYLLAPLPNNNKVNTNKNILYYGTER